MQPATVALRAELLARKDADQRARRALPYRPSPAEWAVVQAVDHASTARMRQVLAVHGWPGHSLVGEDGSRAAWLLVQHGPLDLQEQALPLLAGAVRCGDASPVDLAYLTDRVRMRQGKPQLYGTQYRNGELYPVEDPGRLDERRAAVGLGPHAGYDVRMRERMRQTGPSPHYPAGVRSAAPADPGPSHLLRRVNVQSPGTSTGGVMDVLRVAGLLAATALAWAAVTTAAGCAGPARAAGSPVPAPAVPRLAAIASGVAKADGDPAPSQVTAVLTTRAKALTSATPGDLVPGSGGLRVFLVTMQGHFVAGDVSVPPGAAAPAGRYLALVVDASTFQVLDFGLSPNPPAISPGSLGPVTYLTGPPPVTSRTPLLASGAPL